MFIRVDNGKNNSLARMYFEGDIVGFKRLIDEGANVNCLTKTGKSLISLIIRGDGEINKKFFDEMILAGAHLGKIGDEEPLINISISKNKKNYYLTKLLENGCNPDGYNELSKIPINNKIPMSDRNETSLFFSMEKGCMDETILLLQHGANPKLLNSDNETLLNILITKIEKNDHATLSLFIEKGADPLARDIKGTTLLHKMVQYHTDKIMFDTLFERNIDIDAVDKFGCTALIHAVNRHNDDAMEILIDKGVDLDVKNVFGDTAALVAANRLSPINEDIKKLKILDNANANFSIPDGSGNTVFHYISMSNDKIDMGIDILKKHPKLLLIKNSEGRTALDNIKTINPNTYKIFEKIIHNNVKHKTF